MYCLFVQQKSQLLQQYSISLINLRNKKTAFTHSVFVQREANLHMRTNFIKQYVRLFLESPIFQNPLQERKFQKNILFPADLLNSLKSGIGSFRIFLVELLQKTRISRSQATPNCIFMMSKAFFFFFSEKHLSYSLQRKKKHCFNQIGKCLNLESKL